MSTAQRPRANAPARTGPDEQTATFYLVAIVGLLMALVAGVAVIAGITVIGAGTAVALHRRLVDRRQVTIAAAAGVVVLASAWPLVGDTIGAAREDFRVAFGGALPHPQWSWLLAGGLVGWPVGAFAGLGLATFWGVEDQRTGGRDEKPIKVSERTARRLTAERGELAAVSGQVLLGIDRSRRPYVLELAELGTHALVLGATGSGKTTTLLVLIEAAMREQRPVIVIDLKGDPGLTRAMDELARRHMRVFESWSIDGQWPYNPLCVGGPSELKDKLVGMEQWSEPHYQRAAERYLQTVFTVLAELGEVPSLQRVVELLNPGALKALVRMLPAGRDDQLWTYLDGLNRDHLSAIAGLQNRLALLTESQAGQWLHAREGEGIDIARALHQADVVHFSLNSSTYGGTAAQLGGLIAQDIKAAAGRRIGTGKGALVVIDEFSALAGDHVLALLARGRSAGIGVVLATQELADLSRVDPGFLDQVLGNTATKLIMRQEVPTSAETLAQIAGTRQVWEATRQIDEHAIGRRRTGMGSERLVDTFTVHPNEIKGLGCGELFVVRNDGGRRADRVRVVPVTLDWGSGR